jgi:hypothetical protein
MKPKPKPLSDDHNTPIKTIEKEMNAAQSDGGTRGASTNWLLIVI